MREYKFRFYNEDYGMSETFTLIDCMYPGDNGGIPQRYKNISLQYTGLKDKNGKEIYEGDIVKYHIGTFDAFKIGIVKYELGYYYPLSLNHPGTEVVGNIYENPELLEKSE